MNVPKLIVPVLVVIALFSGYFLRTAFTKPSTVVTQGTGEGKKLECTVAGVRCKGTARFLTSLYENVPGVNGIVTYAADRRVIFTYDPDIITPDSIRAIMEAPILFDDGSSVQVYECLSMEED
ncbi:MAG: hypothetical protein ABII79_12895 [bacterium]